MALPRLLKQVRSRRSWRKTRGDLTRWYASPLGRRMLTEQQDIVDQILPRCFGQQVVISGVMADRLTLEASVIPQRALVSNAQAQVQRSREVLGLSPIQAELTSLPFDSHSVDVMVLHHSLDVEHNVHSVLRELGRVVVPGGTLIVIGFNPWSLWGGIRQMNKLLNRGAPWSCRFMSQFNLSDWLKLLDFEVEGCEYAFFMPPINHEPVLNALSALRLPFGSKMSGFGASYLLVAKKRQTLMTPIKPMWRRPRLMSMPPAQPSL